MIESGELLVKILKASWGYAPAKINKRWSGLGLFLYCLCFAAVWFFVWLGSVVWLAGRHTDICTGAILALILVVFLSSAVNYLVGNALDAAEQPDEERPWRDAVAEGRQESTALSSSQANSRAPDTQELPVRAAAEVKATTDDTVLQVTPVPADEGSVAAECAACEAWNPPGSAYCSECGAALE
jgi:hypothetical protein